MTVRRAARPFAIFALTIGLVVFAGGLSLFGQNPTLTVLSRDGRRTLPLAIVGDQEFVALDDLANLFQLTVREESGALTVTDKGRTIVLTPDQAIASISGRLIAPGAVRQFAEALRCYVEDANLRGRHGAAGEERSLDFSWDRINQAVADTYLRLVRQKAIRSRRR